MKGLRRVLLVLWGIAMTAVGVLAVLCASTRDIRVYWLDMLSAGLADMTVGLAVGAGLLVLGIISIFVGIYTKKELPFAKVSMGEFGSVDVSLAAVDNVVKKVAAGIDGVKEVKSRIKVENNVVDILLDVVMSPDCNIPDTIALLQQDVRLQLETSVGLKVNNVKTAITNIVSANK